MTQEEKLSGGFSFTEIRWRMLTTLYMILDHPYSMTRDKNV
jgi:hypothetical protein